MSDIFEGRINSCVTRIGPPIEFRAFHSFDTKVPKNDCTIADLVKFKSCVKYLQIFEQKNPRAIQCS
jgi:hypothetical protein